LGIRRFEDIAAWQAARRLVNAIYSATKGTPFGRDRDLCSQVRRAAISAMLNIAEGFARGLDTNQEFRQHLRYAIGSAREVQACLYVALDQGYVDEDGFAGLYAVAGEVAALSTRLSGALKRAPEA
jgi:four helix bundle protein